MSFLLDLIDKLDLSAILIPAQSKDSRREKAFVPLDVDEVVCAVIGTKVLAERDSVDGSKMKAILPGPIATERLQARIKPPASARGPRTPQAETNLARSLGVASQHSSDGHGGDPCSRWRPDQGTWSLSGRPLLRDGTEDSCSGRGIESTRPGP